MRTMACLVIFSVIVACSLQQVFAIDCSSINLQDLKNCDDCARCGGHWCNKPAKKGDPHCVAQVTDIWCSGFGNIEELPKITTQTVEGEVISPIYFETTAKVDKHSARVTIDYQWSGNEKPNVHVSVINTTQTRNVQIMEKTFVKNGKYATHLSIKPDTNFCLPDGGLYEYIWMNVHVGNISQNATVKYHVPCACACSYTGVETFSPVCNDKGDLKCGACSCHKGWTGEFCEVRPECHNKRGDVQCTHPYLTEKVYCSGNGECGPCDTCICFKDREGYQYFQEDNYCSSLCQTISNDCEPCLYDIPLGQCSACESLTAVAYNKTLLLERDSYDRKMWVTCKDVIDGCSFEYAAMRDEHGQMYMMKISSCNGNSGAIAGGQVNVMLPTVLSIIAIVAAVAAVAGYMVWKARNPPMPLASSLYQELDGPEGSTGINPLYRDPNSSYNNPLWKGAKV